MSTSESEENPGVLLRRDGPVATISLCRPAVLNAQTPRMWEALRRIGAELPGDVRVVVVKGEGRSFSAGIDLTVAQGGEFHLLASSPDEEALERIAGYQAAFSWLGRPDIVSIAAVHGHAIGAGFQLALACDLRVLADDAQLRLPEVTLGLVPDLTGTSNLVDLVGYGRALEMCLTGRAVGASEARAIGIANLVVPLADLDGAVADLVAALLAPPAGASRATAGLIRSAVHNDHEAQDAAERAAQVQRLHDLVSGR